MIDEIALHVALSFFAGGAYVAFAMLLAERLGPKLGGIAITAPSTVVFSLLFIGLSSAEKAAQAAAIVPAAAGATALFVAAYARLLKRTALAPFGALAVWLLFSLPFAAARNRDMLVSTAAFAVLFLASARLLRSVRHVKPVRMRFDALRFAFRSAFAGGIIALSVYLARTAGAEWGGLLAGFPAAVFSSFMLLSVQRGAAFAAAAAKTMPLGLSSIVLFAAIAHYAYPAIGAVYGTLLAYLSSLAFVAAVYKKISQ
jgi:hypothetical protein